VFIGQVTSAPEEQSRYSWERAEVNNRWSSCQIWFKSQVLEAQQDYKYRLLVLF